MLLAAGDSQHKELDTTYSYSSHCSTDAALSMQAWKYWPVYPYVNLSAFLSRTKLNRNGWFARAIKMSGLQKSLISARAFEILHIYWRGLEPNEKIPDTAINSALQPALLGLKSKETADPPCIKQGGSMAGLLCVWRSWHTFTAFMWCFLPSHWA